MPPLAERRLRSREDTRPGFPTLFLDAAQELLKPFPKGTYHTNTVWF
jgi:hypothetical protein